MTATPMILIVNAIRAILRAVDICIGARKLR
jgi:hypothetical protein